MNIKTKATLMKLCFYVNLPVMQGSVPERR